MHHCLYPVIHLSLSLSLPPSLPLSLSLSISLSLSPDIDIGEWQEQSDSSKLRDLHYTVALNYSFGPKFSPTTEHQVYSSSGQPGLKHLVHTEVCTTSSSSYIHRALMHIARIFWYIVCFWCTHRLHTGVLVCLTCNFWALVPHYPHDRILSCSVKMYHTYLVQYTVCMLGAKFGFGPS